jgi:hypothetical protein
VMIFLGIGLSIFFLAALYFGFFSSDKGTQRRFKGPVKDPNMGGRSDDVENTSVSGFIFRDGKLVIAANLLKDSDSEVTVLREHPKYPKFR